MERALLFTDVVDSTRLTEQLGDARAARLWAAHDRKARELLAAHGVREVERTDGFFLLFDRAADAASFALAYHEALAELGMKARVGLHVGPVSVHENAPEDVARGAKRVEVEGLAKPIAARVLALAGGGQTLVTTAAREALAGTVPEGAEIRRHGYYRFKGIDAPIEIFELGVRGRSPFVPPRDADKAYRVVRSGTPGGRPARFTTTCPPSATCSSAAAPSWSRLPRGSMPARVSSPCRVRAEPARRAWCGATA